MLRDADYLYNRSTGNPFLADGEMLFDVRHDPQQRTNLAAQTPEIVAAYRHRLADWSKRNAAVPAAGQAASAPPF